MIKVTEDVQQEQKETSHLQQGEVSSKLYDGRDGAKHLHTTHHPVDDVIAQPYNVNSLYGTTGRKQALL